MKHLVIIITLLITVNCYSQGYSQEKAEANNSIKTQTEQALLDNSKDLIVWAKESAKESGSFVKEQAPLVAKEYVQYTIAYSLLVISLPFISFIFFATVLAMTYKYRHIMQGDDGFFGMIALVCMVVSLFIAIPITVENLNRSFKLTEI